MTDYVGIIDRNGDVWGVRIPDMPGCYGAGGSADAAIRDAASACARMDRARARRGAPASAAAFDERSP